MFLKALQIQNPALIDSAIALLQSGAILPDTYVVDVDQFTENAQLIKAKADQYGVKLYGMTKQLGRNPLLAKILVDELGYDGIVCVDYKEARQLHLAGVRISHIGHLVQPPSHYIPYIVSTIQPDVITVYSLDKAREISAAAVKAKRHQGILLKFFHASDCLYTNQEAGFPIESLETVCHDIAAMPNLQISGLTHFPCFLYNPATQSTDPTHNLDTLLDAKAHAERLGYQISQLNMPSATSCHTLGKIQQFEGTHGEPGHALTGTIPANQDASQPEKVALAYATEVSHQFGGTSYCYGGGYYRRGQLDHALVRHTHQGSVQDTLVGVHNDDEASIDYHLQLEHLFPVGTPVIMAFRTQIFVTRSDVALVTGISNNQPALLGLYDAQGNEVKHG
ncbi:YhfX family PLP-dependent enzyme [Photobacterium sp. ZSDE20]|uniref:YhfX family PLP-dependent enzyme n=1 Tax=Photobacterium pectinilyticum TaxID=2906793 RepID=A0ABT1MVV8_9GAMM|nr:YhfX family PLP-dependent enzyme [Photobacterium sp. ZSDE20]MCQ1056630.1 YhfX family PLP-dependent enzyme [Photobacterium sp. ZSDE20]MDD1820765.1 YhfX family PLP-dependent enzyme [Photobacterium sp. ZSDE20]